MFIVQAGFVSDGTHVVHFPVRVEKGEFVSFNSELAANGKYQLRIFSAGRGGLFFKGSMRVGSCIRVSMVSDIDVNSGMLVTDRVCVTSGSRKFCKKKTRSDPSVPPVGHSCGVTPVSVKGGI